MEEIKFVVLRPSRTRVPTEGTVAFRRAYALIKVHFFKQKRDKSLLSSICLSPPKASFQGDRQIDDNRIKFYFLLKKCTFICVCAKFVVPLQTF